MLRPDCGEGQVAVVLEGCWVCVDRVTCLPVPDTECEAAGGYCADFQERCDRGYEGAGPMDCPAGQSAQCCLPARDERCDDGSEWICDMEAPECQEGSIPALIEGCWQCVNPATCRPWGEPGCAVDADCPPADWCNPCGTASCPMCRDCRPACDPHGCPTEREAVCNMIRPACDDGQVAVVRDGCWVCLVRDTCEPPPQGEDCEAAGGYCEHWQQPCREDFESGHPMDCPGGRSAQCCLPARDESCDDGRDVVCAMVPPVCEPFEILAAQGGCWVCVNPATCLPWGEPGCERDADCPADARCDPCGTAACPDCDACAAACTPHRCETALEAACDMERPDCEDGQVAVVRDACWVCVELRTCEPPPPGALCEAADGYCEHFVERCRLNFHDGPAMDCPGGRSAKCCLPGRDRRCDDGTELRCDELQPRCGEFDILAIREGCWVCANPATCRPWGEPGCDGDMACGPSEWCDPCGTSGCPLCENCVAACRPHGCASEADLMCWCARPECGDRGVAVIRDGCWICVDAETCRALPDAGCGERPARE